MLPTLLDTRVAGMRVTLPAYGTLLALAAVVTVTLAWWLARRRGIPGGRAAALLGVTAVCVPIGARLLHLALNPSVYAADPGALLSTDPTGFALYGGLILATIAGLVTAWVLRVDLWRMADASAPAIGVGIALARLGCFLNGCCFGRVTTGPLGIVFPGGSLPWLGQLSDGRITLLDATLPVYPTQLFELAGALAGSALAVWVLTRGARDGTAFLAFAAWFSAVRWADWYLRVPASSFAGPSWMYPALYAALIAVCVTLIIVRRRGGEAAGASRAAPRTSSSGGCTLWRDR
jgi:phosphatidylglycerol:prolipoprotein diacylglycerol transferase